MTQTPAPGERRLARPPSERYATPEPDPADAPGSLGRAIAYGALASLAGVVVTILLGGVLALSAGLLVVWAATGDVVGMLTRVGGGTRVGPSTRIAVAIVLALIGVALGQLGLWWYAGTEGGVLPLLDYLAQAFGILVPLQAVLAAGFAWWGSR